ncbi:hypothetical protein N9N28_07780 [Rubripirellula amarantea]|nr:hypothetical protein [Rubripirellula amarantea]
MSDHKSQEYVSSHPQPNPQRSSQLSWNAGAWFGPMIGGTAWMAASGIMLLKDGILFPGIISIGGFVLVCTVTAWMWAQRHHRDYFTSLMQALALVAILTPVIFFTFKASLDNQALRKVGVPENLYGSLFICGLVPAIMIFLASTIGRRQRPEPPQP